MTSLQNIFDKQNMRNWDIVVFCTQIIRQQLQTLKKITYSDFDAEVYEVIFYIYFLKNMKIIKSEMINSVTVESKLKVFLERIQFVYELRKRKVNITFRLQRNIQSDDNYYYYEMSLYRYISSILANDRDRVQRSRLKRCEKIDCLVDLILDPGTSYQSRDGCAYGVNVFASCYDNPPLVISFL